MPAHVETVVIFLPDVWTCRPTSLEWQTLAAEYKKQLDSKLSTEEFKTKAESTFFVMPFFRIVCDCFVRVGCYCSFFDMFKKVFVSFPLSCCVCCASVVMLCSFVVVPVTCACFVSCYLCLFRLILVVLFWLHCVCCTQVVVIAVICCFWVHI